SGHSTQCSWTSTQPSPRCAATAATWRVWFDCTPPIETNVSQPCASASAARYSSLRTLLPPYARPELQSSRFIQTSTAPPRCSVSRRSGCTGDGPNVRGTRSKSARLTKRMLRGVLQCRLELDNLSPLRLEVDRERGDRSDCDDRGTD